MWANAADMHRRAAGKPIRLASKSVRCRTLHQRVLARPGFRGTFAFTLPEALWLAGQRTEDILVAYPTADRQALRKLAGAPELAAGARVTVMVDSVEHLQLIGRARGRSPAPAVRVCIDVDAGWHVLRGRLRVGAKRSPVHAPEQAAALAREILARQGLALVGVVNEHKGTAYYLLYTPDPSTDIALDTAWLKEVGAKDKCKKLVVYCEKLWAHRDELAAWEKQTGRSLRTMIVPVNLK